MTSIVLYLSLIVCIAGAVVYLLVKDGKVQELARICFFAGLLAYLLKG